MGYSDYWKNPIHKILKKHRDKFPSLGWLRISISYHKFSNVREHLQGDLTTKLMEGIGSKDFLTQDCNCRIPAKCAYFGKCRTSIVIYQATCLKTGMKYIGNTQQLVKKRIQQHVQDVKTLVMTGKKSDSFAEHFAQLVPKGLERKEVAKEIQFKVDILWKGNPVSCVKTFGTKKCKLCSKERIEILNSIYKDPTKTINKNNEIYGACRHNPKFHEFCRLTSKAEASTDESGMDERVNRPISTQSTDSESSFNFELQN